MPILHVKLTEFLELTMFSGKFGHVRYYVKASIVKPWKFDHNTKVVFTVLDELDLNKLSDVKVRFFIFVQ